MPTLLAGESLLIVTGAAVCNRALGHPEWVPAWIAFAVGVHFFPMAAILRLRRFHALAVAMCTVAAATALVAGNEHARQDLWLALPGYGSALALWLSSLIGLRGLHRRVGGLGGAGRVP